MQNIATKVASTAQAGEQIRSGVDGVASSAERMAARSEELAALSGNLKDILTFFKLRETRGDAYKPANALRAIPAGHRR